ncbi:MAG TPA: NADH-quinone oxidoreductase subunit L [bacterium]|nr:NADH-quinone oxidoreductase subunit L [bacterium]
MLPLLIILVPLAGWLINGLYGGRLSKTASGALASAAVGLAFLLALAALRNPLVWQAGWRITFGPWIAAGGFSVEAGLLLDRLSAVMVLVVTGVGFLIHVYSIGYMADEPTTSRYFAYLNLFIASMLILVLGSNLLVLFVGWELVGMCSYLLIGYWFARPRAAAAARKAFIVNRIGDAGFLLGMLALVAAAGTLDFAGIERAIPSLTSAAVVGITLLLFFGATGKSAQLPLYVWLPDAMEGPTPVSALIHAATMVTAGVYMIGRLHVLFEAASATLAIIAAVGTLTALFAATVALVEWDLKRVLAYSTISQLGYMFLAMGVVAMPAGLFHLTTHAFFKALLFLAAGSVMHAMRGTIDMRALGGLAGPLRWTALGFTIGALALAGLPPFAGFFSKDLILEAAFAHARGGASYLLYAGGLLTAFVTAAYITRAVVLTFVVPARHESHPHEASESMAWPMVALAALSMTGGLLGAAFVGAPLLRNLDRFFEVPPVESSVPPLILTVIAVAVAALGAAAGWLVYRWRPREALGAVGRVFSRGWYIEDAYRALILAPGRALAAALATTVETGIIDGAVNGIAAVLGGTGGGLRRLQTGYVRNYAAVILAGVILLMGYWILR